MNGIIDYDRADELDHLMETYRELSRIPAEEMSPAGRIDDTDAAIDVLAENVSACQAGKVRSGLTVAMETEQAATNRVLNVIAVFGFRPVLRALAAWCSREPEQCLAAECDRLLRAFDDSRHPMLRECEDDGNDNQPTKSPGRDNTAVANSNGTRPGAPFINPVPAWAGCPGCGNRDRASLVSEASAHYPDSDWMHCDVCSTRFRRLAGGGVWQ